MVENIEILYEIKLSAEAQKEIKKSQTTDATKGKDKTITEKKQKDTQKEKITEGEEFIKDIDSKGLGNLRSLATNPESLVSGQFLSFLTKGGPQGALIATLITTAISSPEAVAQIIKVLAAPGGPLNRDWKRFIESQIDAGLTKSQLERRQVGADILILPQKLGFIPSNEAWASSNLLEIDAKKVARIGLTDKEEGLFE